MKVLPSITKYHFARAFATRVVLAPQFLAPYHCDKDLVFTNLLLEMDNIVCLLYQDCDIFS